MMLAERAHRAASAGSTGACCRPASSSRSSPACCLPAPAEILRRRLPQRRGEMTAMARPIRGASGSAPPRAPDASAATIRDVARQAAVSIGTVSKALNNARQPAAGDARQGASRVAGELGFRPNDLAQSLHRGQSFTVGLISNDSFGRFTLPIMEASSSASPTAASRVFMCNATDDPARERQHIDQLLGKRVDGLVVTARRADRRAPIERPRSARAGRLRLLAGRRPRRASASCPTTKAGRRSRPSISPARPPPHRPCHRPRALRGRAPPPRRLAQGGSPGRPRRAGRLLPARHLVGGLGPRGRAQLFARPLPRRPTRSSAATTRSPAASPTRCASAASPCPRTSRSSASTIGTSWRRRRGRRSPAST